MDMTIVYGVAMFTVIVVALVAIILAARSKLVAAAMCRLKSTVRSTIEVPAGGKLLQTLADADLFLASACGGGGTCAQCKCVVKEGGGAMLPTEEGHFTRREANEGWRLSCQTPVKQDMKIQIPEEVFRRQAVGVHG
jgi:Na+-transporting NADH:ubiquinone oxidoreductase subunit F